MTFRSASRAAFAAVLSLIIASAVLAAPRRRAALARGPKTDATLTGTVKDASSGAALPQVQVTSGTNNVAHTATNGTFVVTIPMGKDVPLTFTRSGYNTLTSTVNIAHDDSRTFQMTSLPTVKVRQLDGTTLELDTDTVEFGYLAPFTGYTKDRKMNLCTTAGQAFTPDRADIHRITGPIQFNDPACCDKGALPGVNVELKAGGNTTGGFVDACVGYHEDLIGLDHKTGLAAYIHFSDISEITFP
jgi:carboxypeptidase-like protein